MKKVMGILNIATKVMMFIVCTVIAAISLTTAYIMFAPDEFPKPFRLVYNLTGSPTTMAISNVVNSETGHSSEGEVTAEGETEGEEVHAAETTMVSMATKIINLSDPSGRKYIRLTVVLEFEMPAADEEEAAASSHSAEEAVTPEQAFQDELAVLMPMMDDAVITLLSTKTYEQLYTAEGKEGLRTELRDAIQTRLPDYHLMNIYFTEFVVQ